MKTAKKIAVLLCGSGYKDGSEIRESVGVLWALSLHKASVQCFAPDANQFDVVNCLTGEAAKGETRNMLVEAARIARGNILSLTKLKAKDFDGIIIPGGFGAAKNLCSFALKGSHGSVNAELLVTLKEFKIQKKPIGAVCIAPAIIALAFKGEGIELSVGEKSETAEEIEKLGHTHFVTKPNQCHVDKKNKIITTPAYMYDNAPIHEIFEGINNLVKAVLERA